MNYLCVCFCLQPSRCVNQIEDVCKDIEKTINQTIQNTLNSLEKDCEKIAKLVDQKLELDRYRLNILDILRIFRSIDLRT